MSDMTFLVMWVTYGLVVYWVALVIGRAEGAAREKRAAQRAEQQRAIAAIEAELAEARQRLVDATAAIEAALAESTGDARTIATMIDTLRGTRAPIDRPRTEGP